MSGSKRAIFMNLSLNEFHLEDIKSPNHGAVFAKSKDYTMLILRLFEYKNKKIRPFNINLIIKNDEIFCYENGEFVAYSFDELFSKLDPYIDRVVMIGDEFLKQTQKFEDKFYSKHNIKNFNSSWFELKSGLIKISSILLQSCEALKDFYIYHCKDSESLKYKFGELVENLERSKNYAFRSTQNLDTLYSLYSKFNNDKIQSSIYTLTLISGIFLPLNLIVGFFGMNVSSLPFTSGKGGIFFVVAIMSVVIACFVLLLKFIIDKNTK